MSWNLNNNQNGVVDARKVSPVFCDRLGAVLGDMRNAPRTLPFLVIFDRFSIASDQLSPLLNPHPRKKNIHPARPESDVRLLPPNRRKRRVFGLCTNRNLSLAVPGL